MWICQALSFSSMAGVHTSYSANMPWTWAGRIRASRDAATPLICAGRRGSCSAAPPPRCGSPRGGVHLVGSWGCDGDGNPKWEGKGEAVRERERGREGRSHERTSSHRIPRGGGGGVLACAAPCSPPSPERERGAREREKRNLGMGRSRVGEVIG